MAEHGGSGGGYGPCPRASTLRKGLEVGPKSPDLHFNLGINLLMQKRSKDAEASLKTAAALKPGWSSIWRALAQALEDNGKRLEAFLVKSRFVAMEPNTPRGKRAAATLWPMLMAGIEQKKGEDGKRMIDVSVGKGANPDDMLLSLTAASRFTEEKKSDGQFFVSALTTMVDYSAEGKDRAFLTEAAGLFLAAKKAGVLDALGWTIRRAADDPDADTWFSTHRNETQQVMDFMRAPIPH